MDNKNKKYLEELFNRALNNHLSRQFEDALILYKKILNTNPDIAVVQNNLGLIYKELGKQKIAIGLFEKAVTINSKYLEGYNNLGATYNQLNEFKKAMSFVCLYVLPF